MNVGKIIITSSSAIFTKVDCVYLSNSIHLCSKEKIVCSKEKKRSLFKNPIYLRSRLMQSKCIPITDSFFPTIPSPVGKVSSRGKNISSGIHSFASIQWTGHANAFFKKAYLLTLGNIYRARIMSVYFLSIWDQFCDVL